MRIPITSRRCHEPGFDWADWVWRQVVLPVNGDPFIGMLETPVTSAPVVAGFLSNLPAYRTGVSPLLRGVEVGLAHGFLVRPLPCPPCLLPPSHLSIRRQSAAATATATATQGIYPRRNYILTHFELVYFGLADHLRSWVDRFRSGGCCGGGLVRVTIVMPRVVQLGGPFTKLGPLRNVEGVAEISGHLSAAGLVLILTACLTIYGAVAFQQEKSQIGIKTLSGAALPPSPLPPPFPHTWPARSSCPRAPIAGHCSHAPTEI